MRVTEASLRLEVRALGVAPMALMVALIGHLSPAGLGACERDRRLRMGSRARYVEKQ